MGSLPARKHTHHQHSNSTHRKALSLEPLILQADCETEVQELTTTYIQKSICKIKAHVLSVHTHSLPLSYSLLLTPNPPVFLSLQYTHSSFCVRVCARARGCVELLRGSEEMDAGTSNEHSQQGACVCPCIAVSMSINTLVHRPSHEK